MKANVIMPEIREGTEKDVKVDADKIPNVEWNCLCAVLLPAMREYFGLDKPERCEGNEVENCTD